MSDSDVKKAKRSGAAYKGNAQDITKDAYFYEDANGLAVHIWEQINGFDELWHAVIPWPLLQAAVGRHERVVADRPNLAKAHKKRGIASAPDKSYRPSSKKRTNR